MKYFSIDYRSPPSGMGQIVDTSLPPMIDGKHNYILVSYSGCGGQDNPYYVETKYFHSEQAEQEGWAGPIIKEIIQYLKDQGVTHVYDSELSFEEVGSDDGMFSLKRWSKILMRAIEE